MAGARSHKDLICWQRAYELKLHVYELLRAGTITGDIKLREQLRESAAAAPRLMAEGFGRYYTAEFSKYLRFANGELQETIESLDDGVDRRHFTRDQVIPLQRLAKRSSKAATRLIAYLRTADAPDGSSPAKGRRRREPKEPREPEEPREPGEPKEQDPRTLEPSEPIAPKEQDP
jgi:four helix bundle protein